MPSHHQWLRSVVHPTKVISVLWHINSNWKIKYKTILHQCPPGQSPVNTSPSIDKWPMVLLLWCGFASWWKNFVFFSPPLGQSAQDFCLLLIFSVRIIFSSSAVAYSLCAFSAFKKGIVLLRPQSHPAPRRFLINKSSFIIVVIAVVIYYYYY